MSDLFTTIVELVGAALIVTGVAMFNIPAALIVAGVLTPELAGPGHAVDTRTAGAAVVARLG